MKESIKKTLKKLNIYEALSCAYHMIRQARPSYVLNEFRYRTRGAPDGFPVPPPHLIFRIIARGWAEQYYAMGREAAEEIVRLLSENGIDVGRMSAILDFGCGCGRIMRHLRAATGAALYGSDYNADLIRWCRENLSFGNFGVNDLEPPLCYEDGKFDLIYMISVFTHLGADLQREWIAELRRVLRRGGVILFTTHGEQYREFLSEEQWERLREGEVVVIERDEEGSNHYGSFQTQKNVSENLLDGFELLSFKPGRERLAQDMYIIRKKF